VFALACRDVSRFLETRGYADSEKRNYRAVWNCSVFSLSDSELEASGPTRMAAPRTWDFFAELVFKLRRPQVVVDMDFAGIRSKRCDRTVQRSTKRKEKLQSDRRQEGWKESEFHLPICIAMAWL